MTRPRLSVTLPRSLRLSRAGLVGMLLLALVALPRGAAAQWCIGSPNLPGEFSMGLYLDFMDQGTGYGLTTTANLDNPFAIGATLGTANLDDLDENQTVASAMGLMELPLRRLTVCPVVEVQWATVSETLSGGTLDVDQWVFPLGVSGGTLLSLNPTIDLLPSARLGIIHVRNSFSAEAFDSETATEFFLDGGATLSMTPFFLRGSFRWISGEEEGELGFDTFSGSAFGLVAGLRF